MMLSPEQQYQFINNRLLSHKSSFQAWKCVSFGCSLLVMMLLISKYYEVNSDLNLLLGIDQLLMFQEESNNTLTWPPVPIDMVLPAPNETNFGIESLESNGTMLMSHMHMSLSREHTGNQLLRQEVGAFIAEFRTAKSTLGLSSLLVAIYIVSWVLMTLAINDTRISNDISLRNILLLSVFGAIDVASSVGFVMVRVIMFSVKNSSFALEVFGSSGLKDTPVRLSADQLTAFTALRLIAMRSCSAYTDLYVSTVVALLTVLRLYAIIRALTYYRKLRRLTDHRPGQHSFGGNDHSKPIWSSSMYSPHSLGHHLFAAHHHQLISPQLSGQQQQQQSHLELPEHTGSAESLMMRHSPGERAHFRLSSSAASYQPQSHHLQQQQQHQRTTTTSPTQRTMPLDVSKSTFRTYQSGSVPPTSKLMFSSPQVAQHQPPPQPPPPPPPSPPLLQTYQLKLNKQQSQQSVAAASSLAAASGGKSRTNRLITSSQPQLLQPQQQQQQLSQQSLRHSAATLNRSPVKPRLRPYNRNSYHANPNSSAPNLLFMTTAGGTGVATVRAGSYLGPLAGVHREEADQCESDPPRRERRTPAPQPPQPPQQQQQPASGGAGSGVSSRSRPRQYEDETTGTENEVAFDEQVASGQLRVEAGQQDLLGSSPRHYQHQEEVATSRYTLLDPEQLDKIGRRLLQAAAASGVATTKAQGGGGAGSRYRQANRYKQILVSESPTLLKTSVRTRVASTSSQSPLARHGRHRRVQNSSATSVSSSPDDDSDASRERSLHRSKRRAGRRSALPLREEFVAEAGGDLAAHRLFEVDGKNGPSFLLGKCSKLDEANKRKSAHEEDEDDGCSAESGITGL